MAEHELNKIVDDEGEVFNLRDSTKQPTADRVTSWSSTPSDTKYPSEKLVKDSLDAISTNARTIPQDVSKGVNLVVNGSGLMGNNYNWYACSFNANTDLPEGVAGCFHRSGGAFFQEEKIAINTSKSYIVESWYRVKTANTSTVRLTVACYDVDAKSIEAIYSTYGVGTLTQLTEDLKPGDTVVHLADLSNSNWKSATNYQHGFIFWNYKNSYGYQYPPETYSRNVYPSFGSVYLWTNVSQVDQTNNTITLDSAWSGPTIPAGTYVSRRNSGSLYYYAKTSATRGALTTWTKLSGLVKGFVTPGYTDGGAFRPGTAFIRVGWVNANTSGNEWFEFAGCELREIPEKISGTLPVGNGGTGNTTAKAAEYNLTTGKSEISDTTSGDDRVVFELASPSESNGVTRGFRKLSTIWTWIKGLLSSESGVDISGNAATATTAAGYTSDGAIATALDGKATTSHTHGNIANDGTDGLATHDTTKFLRGDGTWSVPPVTEQVQSDWNQATTTADDYIKNKPQNLVQDASYVHTDNNYTTEDKGKVASAVQPGDLGTAAYKDVPESGDASTTQVVMGSDSRLTRSVWSGGGTAVCGYKICTTSRIAGKSGQTSNIYAIVMGSMCLTNKYAAQPQGSDSAGVDGALAMGSFMIWCEGKPDGSITARARLFSSDAALNNADIALCKKYVNGAVEWFVAFGPWGSSKAVTASRAFGMSVCFDYVQNVNIPDTLEAVPSGYGYEDYYQLWKHPYLQSTNQGAGSSTRPVYVTANGEIKACKQLVQAVTSIDTSSMDPEVLYVM